MSPRHRALPWPCRAVFKGERGYTAAENLGEIRMGLPGIPEPAVCPWDTALSTGFTSSSQTSQLENWGWFIIQSWEAFPGALSLGGASYSLIWGWDI